MGRSQGYVGFKRPQSNEGAYTSSLGFLFIRYVKIIYAGNEDKNTDLGNKREWGEGEAGLPMNRERVHAFL